MHPEIDQFIQKVKDKHPQYFQDVKVLEVGSQNINGSVRSHFTNCEYLGIDLGEAPGVDLVTSIIGFHKPGEYDMVISSEMLEHCREWKEALAQMYINTKPGGMFLLTCASDNRQEHGTHNHTSQDSKFTLDHYRNISVEDFRGVLPSALFKEYDLGLYRGGCDLYFYGIKNGGE